MDFVVPADHRVKLKENEKRDNYLDLARELKKIIEHESASDTSYDKRALGKPQRIGTGTAELGIMRTSEDHPNDSIVEIGQKTEKSPGDLRRLADTQTPMRNNHLMLRLKTLKRVK